MLTCAMSWESFSHGFAPALSSPLRKTAPYGRPVHRLGDRAGRSPGSRVVAQLRPAFPVSQWPCGRGLAAHSCGGSHGPLRIGRFRVPSFVPGFTRGTSTLKCSLQPVEESSGVGTMAGSWRGKTFVWDGTRRRSRIVFLVSERLRVGFESHEARAMRRTRSMTEAA